MEKSKPGLAILIGHALAKKGKAQHDPAPDMKDDMESDGADQSDDQELHDHLEEIATDLIDAVHSKDASAVADLLQEAFECLDAAPHEEYSDEESSSDGKSSGNPY